MHQHLFFDLDYFTIFNLKNFNAGGLKETNCIALSIVLREEDLFYVADVNQSFGTGGAGQVSHKNVLFHVARAVAVDSGVFFGMQTAAVTHLIAVTAIRQTGRVAVVTGKPIGTQYQNVLHTPALQLV